MRKSTVGIHLSVLGDVLCNTCLPVLGKGIALASRAQRTADALLTCASEEQVLCPSRVHTHCTPLVQRVPWPDSCEFPALCRFFFCNQKNLLCCFSCLNFLSDSPSAGDYPGFVQGGNCNNNHQSKIKQSSL